MKTCTKCRTEKARGEFGRHVWAKDGLQSQCKECQRGYHRENREKYAAQRRAYYQEHRERIRERSRRRHALKAEVSDGTEAPTFAGPVVCAYCSEVTDSPHVEHVVPLSRGGVHGQTNIVAACSACNLSKGGRSFADWLGTLSPLHRALVRVQVLGLLAVPVHGFDRLPARARSGILRTRLRQRMAIEG